VEATLLIDDGAGQVERHDGLGLDPAHPRWMAQVLCYESELVYPDPSWIDESLWPDDPALAATDWSERVEGGEDRYADLTPEDFFDPQWSPAEEDPANGVHCVASIPEVATLVVPDLYSPS